MLGLVICEERAVSIRRAAGYYDDADDRGSFSGETDDTQRCEGQTAEQFPANQPVKKKCRCCERPKSTILPPLDAE
jgi:hypothetical protein